MSKVAFIIIFIFCATSFAQLEPKNKMKAREVLGPAKVVPPDTMVEDNTTDDDATEDARRAGLKSSKEPMPQIKKKKEEIDPKFRSRNRLIEHPNAEKGLIRIDKDKVYIYKVKPTDQNSAASIRVGFYEPAELENPDNADLSYIDLYDTDYPMILYDQERQYTRRFGRLGWKWGLGAYFAQGTGKFEGTNPNRDPNLDPKEKFSLLMFPLSLGVTYRFQFFDKQWFVPYIEGSGVGIFFAEIRDDDQNPTLGAAYGFAPAAQGSAGIAIPMGSGARAFLDLDREYGINAMYLTGEYRQIVGLSPNYDFTGGLLSFGFTADY